MSADGAARALALDPARSLIVEAPAGSGKTELLSQRLLRLLGSVEQPEQILAITFTRKAAAEMRQRVVETLNAAAGGDVAVPPHRRQSVELARVALERSARLGWSLREQTRRLRILTIDALNSSLARRLPLLTGGIGGVRVADRADALYRQAARRTVEGLGEGGPLGAALERLLASADNSLAKLEAWLAGALPQRDRWIRELLAAADRGLTARVEYGIGRLHDDCLARLERIAGPDAARALHVLLEARCGGPTGAEAPTNPIARTALWREGAALLLTVGGDWRRRFTKREGFGPGSGALRESVDSLLASWRERAGLREALKDIARLPDRCLDADTTRTLDALVPVLQRLLAELKLAFASAACVDHSELAMAAQAALGAVDAPSDLLLALDRRIEHILVDEFQDTSQLQWGLLERLTAGWQSGDGRSLFLVGDPLQSIYRFRDADLGLFLRAQREGIGGLKLEQLRLELNYRSASEVVDWVNRSFPALFPNRSPGEGQEPGFAPAVAARTGAEAGQVDMQILRVESFAQEIERVVAILADERARDPAQSIGVLVRSRSHLIGLRSALAAAGLAAQAVEIDSLIDTSVGLDLIALSSALLHAGDRLAWLALLRGPCCGLGWRDLHALLEGAAERTVRELIEDPQRRSLLSADGSRRAAWLAERLRLTDALRAGLPLGSWIRESWLAIDGPASLARAGDLDLAEDFFRELDTLARNADLDDPAALAAAFSRPTPRAVPATSGIELMTIHRAKGLEFDTVILPGLSRSTAGKDSSLLYLQDITLADGERISLLATAADRDSPLVELLRRIERAEDRQERARLLYVAATRAKQRLYLVAGLKAPKYRPHRDSLLELLSAGASGDDANVDEDGEVDTSESGAQPESDSDSEPGAKATSASFRELPLERLRFDDAIPLPPAAAAAAAAADEPAAGRPEFEWVHPASVQVGTLIHRELQRLSLRAMTAGKPVPPRPLPASYRRELALLGVEPDDLDAAADRVAEALGLVWADPAGRRILHPWPEAWSELRLSLRGPERIEHLQIDRSFVDEQGWRWIVDYKTGRHLGADLDAFLASERERYSPQLERYAAAVATFDRRPLRVGLYFPLLQRLESWIPASAAGR